MANLLQRWKQVVEERTLRWIGVDHVLPLQIDITNACNLRCSHCYHPHHSNDGALSLEAWKGILDDYEALCRRVGYRRNLIVCGGEPLLSPMFTPILQHVLSYGTAYQLVVLTNGTIVNRIDWNVIEQFPDTPIFQVSLDGPDALRHDAIRGTGNFQRALSGLRTLRDRGYKVEILAVLSQQSAAWISEFFELAKAHSIHFLSFARLAVIGQARNLVDQGHSNTLSPFQLRHAYERILHESLRTGIPTNTTTPLMALIDPALGTERRHGESLVVDYRGRLLASSRSGLVLGDVKQEGLENLFYRHPINKALRAGRVKTCGSCRHFTSCGGDRTAAFAATNDFLGPDPGCWIRSNEGGAP